MQSNNILSIAMKITLVAIYAFFLPAQAKGGELGLPASLHSHVVDNNFDPENYEFAQGQFPGAPMKKVEIWNEIEAYLKKCKSNAKSEQKNILEQMHIHAKYLRNIGYQDHLCGQISASLSNIHDFRSWQSFDIALKKSKPYYDLYVSAINSALNATLINDDSNDVYEQLMRRIITDQGYRYPMLGTLDDINGLDKETLYALKQRINLRIFDEDWDNTHWVKSAFFNKSINKAKLDKKSYKRFWLIVQHADNDPSFQVVMIKEMLKLVTLGLLDASDYALSYDRVNLFLYGSQYYGSQLSCQNHKYLPEKMDNPGKDYSILDVRRSSVGLMPESKYLSYLPNHC